MIRAHALILLAAAWVGAGCASRPEPTADAPETSPTVAGDLVATPAAFDDLPGWAEGRHDRALAAFAASCGSLDAKPDAAPLGPPYAGPAGPWRRACAAAADLADAGADAQIARAFFEANFRPLRLRHGSGGTGLATAYYEPEIEARRAPQPPLTEPLLRAPYNLVVLESPALDTYARGVRREAFIRELNGAYTLAPPRGAIRRDAIGADAIGYARLSDVVFLQIQGSGRLTFPGGEQVRAAYAANNGRPYSSIARDLAETGALPLSQASNARIKAWLDAADAAAADAVVNANERYIFFREEPLGPVPARAPGPRGAAGAPLTADASIAVDPAWHAYGTLFWIAPEDVAGAETFTPAPRLGVAQDTGAAIQGPLRADLFFGTGSAAGEAAARVRHQARWWALAPREDRREDLQDPS